MPEPVFTLSLYALPAGGYDVSLQSGPDTTHTLCLDLPGARAAMMRQLSQVFCKPEKTAPDHEAELEQIYERR